MNAVVATGVPAADWASGFDTAWIDFSKGLGAPFGAVLAGSRELIDEAWRWKQGIGGALRQAGVIAAACLYALDNHVERLAEDHENARLLAEGLAELPGVEIDPAEVDSNIVVFAVPDAFALVGRLHDGGVEVGSARRPPRAGGDAPRRRPRRRRARARGRGGTRSVRARLKRLRMGLRDRRRASSRTIYIVLALVLTVGDNDKYGKVTRAGRGARHAGGGTGGHPLRGAGQPPRRLVDRRAGRSQVRVTRLGDGAALEFEDGSHISSYAVGSINGTSVWRAEVPADGRTASVTSVGPGAPYPDKAMTFGPDAEMGKVLLRGAGIIVGGLADRRAVSCSSAAATAGRPLPSLAVPKVCYVCGKGPAFGHSRSHSMVATKRRFNPNLQKVRIDVGGTPRREYVCTRCLKSGKVTKAA